MLHASQVYVRQVHRRATRLQGGGRRWHGASVCIYEHRARYFGNVDRHTQICPAATEVVCSNGLTHVGCRCDLIAGLGLSYRVALRANTGQACTANRCWDTLERVHRGSVETTLHCSKLCAVSPPFVSIHSSFSRIKRHRSFDASVIFFTAISLSLAVCPRHDATSVAEHLGCSGLCLASCRTSLSRPRRWP